LVWKEGRKLAEISVKKNLTKEEAIQAAKDLFLLGLINYDEKNNTIEGITKHCWKRIKEVAEEMKLEMGEMRPDVALGIIGIRVVSNEWRSHLIKPEEFSRGDRILNAGLLLGWYLTRVFEEWEEEMVEKLQNGGFFLILFLTLFSI